ncbi:MAG: RNA pseudouridine synthase [Candidatus Cloacimonetes bacterium 4572_65]|nr:MAG: RNA pseudouridine synthase [Candidatus Cloacimonetes bacterium 4572_65]
MQNREKSFKSSAKKHQPRGLTILYEDQDIIVIDKESGLLTMSTVKATNTTAYYRLTSYVKKGNMKSRNRIFIVHRLDKDTSGLLVFAKTEEAKQYLQDEWKSFKKKYYAVVCGMIPEQEGIIISYLTENSAHKVYSVNDASKGKFAKTGFKVLKQTQKFSLLEIALYTGRKNQIRVHLEEKGFPVAGDKIYGSGDVRVKRLTLHAASLTIKHPYTKKEMTFESEVPAYFSSLVNR